MRLRILLTSSFLILVSSFPRSGLAQTTNVTKLTANDRLTGSLKVPSGKTLTVESGGTLNVTGATLTGFPSPSSAWADITGKPTTLSGYGITDAAPLASPTFTGTVTIPSGASISGYLTTASASSTYAPLASPTFTGTVTIPSGASISGYLTTASAASTYAPLASPTFTGSITANGTGGAITTVNATGISVLVAGSNAGNQLNFPARNGSLRTYNLPDINSANVTLLDTATAASTYLTPAAAGSAYQPISATLTTLSSATAAGLALMDDATATAQRTTLKAAGEADVYDARIIAQVAYPLDAIPGAFAGWGLVPLRASAVGGNAFDMRRTTDSATSTFTFNAGRSTPKASVDSWKGAETAYNARRGVFTQIYDQVGTAHLTQATTTAQPSWLELPDGTIVAAMNGDNLARNAFFSIPDASWSSRNLTVYHVIRTAERTWSGSSSELAINHAVFGWNNSAGGYTGTSAAQSGNRPVTRMWYGGSFTDINPRLANVATQVIAVRYGATATTYTHHDGTRSTLTVQPSGTLSSGAIGRLGGFSLHCLQTQWIATLVYPEHDDDQLAATLAALRQRFSMSRWTANIVYDGDSITAGHDESEGFFDVRYKSWPQECHTGLAARRTTKGVNLAISSQTLDTLNTAAADKVDTALDASHAYNTIVLFAGTNDINAGATAATAISRLDTYVAARRTAGWNRIILCTAIPRENFDSAKNAALSTYNAYIRANTLAVDAVVDLAALSWSFSTHYQGTTPNRIHPNAAGRTLIANAVRSAIESGGFLPQ